MTFRTRIAFVVGGVIAAAASAFVPTQVTALDDLAAGQTGRIEFTSTTPAHHWAIIRGRLGAQQTIWGDLLMPATAGEGKVPLVVMSHGSEGLDNPYAGNIYRDVWAPPLNAAGFAVFIVDSFGPRSVNKVTGPDSQLTWNSVANLSDALHALKLVATHPRIDSRRIYHMGWSRGGQVVLWAAWPTFQQHIVPPDLKWAGSIAIYPGCNMRYRVDHHGKLPAPLMLLLGEKDDHTLPKPCVEYAEELAAAGHEVTYKVYPGAYHVFDRPNQPWRQFREGNFNRCSVDVFLPYGERDPSFGRAVDKTSGRTVTAPQEWDSFWRTCQQSTWVTVESNPDVRAQAVQDVLRFLRSARD